MGAWANDDDDDVSFTNLENPRSISPKNHVCLPGLQKMGQIHESRKPPSKKSWWFSKLKNQPIFGWKYMHMYIYICHIYIYIYLYIHSLGLAPSQDSSDHQEDTT